MRKEEKKLMAESDAFNPQELAEIARARAAFASFLNIHFTTLPDQAFVKRIRNGEFSSVLNSLKAVENVENDISTGAALMSAYLEMTKADPLDKLTENLGVDRTRLYRGVAKGYGPPPPNEMEWAPKGKGFSVLQTIAGIYSQVGLEPSPDVHERLDYISMELDFIGMLALQEAEAWESGDSAKAVELLRLEQSFLTEHLAQWTPAFIDAAMKFVQTDFYKGHMLMLGGYLQQQTAELTGLVEEVGG
jgi:TorA maturation chaperone TorD